MDKSNLIVAAIALTLAACAAPPQGPKPGDRPKGEVLTGFDPAITRKPEACIVNVFTGDDGYIVVDQEPARIRPCPEGSRRYLFWRLEQGSGDQFLSDDAIWFKGPSKPNDLDCKVKASGKVMKCTFGPPFPSGAVYPYGIKVRRVDGTDVILDPTVFAN